MAFSELSIIVYNALSEAIEPLRDLYLINQLQSIYPQPGRQSVYVIDLESSVLVMAVCHGDSLLGMHMAADRAARHLSYAGIEATQIGLILVVAPRED